MKKLKTALLASVLAGSFSCMYADWFSFTPKSTYEKAEAALVDDDKAKAARLYNLACDEGDFKGCNDAGYVYQFGQGVEVNSLKAIELYSKACNGGNYTGCKNAGDMYKEGTGIKKDFTKAKEFYTLGCSKGDRHCSDHLKKLEVIEEQITYGETFKQAQEYCQAGFVDWCGKLGVHYYKGAGADKNLDLAEKYLQQSCNAGYGRWCGWLGHLYFDQKDYFKAFEAVKKACDKGIAEQCHGVGYFYENGHGIRIDIAKAADFYGKACDMKHQQGCDGYKRLKSPQPVQQANSNNSNSDYQQEQLRIQQEQLAIQRQQLQMQQEQIRKNEFNGVLNSINQFSQSVGNMNTNSQQQMYQTQQLQNQYNLNNQLNNTNRQLKGINNNLNQMKFGF